MPANPCFIENASNQQIDDWLAKHPDFAGRFWRYTKTSYAEQGVSFQDALPQLAAEFKMPERVVSRILNANKTVRNVAEEVAKVQRQNRKFLSDNRRYIAESTRSDAARILAMASDGVRGSLLALHGPVIGGIHPIDQLFTPGKVGGFLRAYGRSVKAASPAQTDLMMARLREMPRYNEWVKAGLPIEQLERLEGFHVGGWGGRAMEAGLKPLMYEVAEKLYAGSPELQNPAGMAMIAEQASFATGAIPRGFLGHGKLVRAFSAAQLARSLNVARWMKSFFNPIQTVGTYVQTAIGKASRLLPEKYHRPIPDPAVRRMASNRMWEAGKFLGTMAGMLTLNDQISRLMGSKSRVNFTDPTRPDYLAFRFRIPGMGDYYIKTRGSMEILQMLARSINAASPYQRQRFGRRTFEETVGRYTEYKMTPSLSLGKEVLTGRDVFGRPAPWSKERGTHRHPKYTYPEYFGQHFPIFIGHGVESFHEGMRESGADPTNIAHFWRTIRTHPEIFARSVMESAGEFFGINLQRERGKPYKIPEAQRQFEERYLP